MKKIVSYSSAATYNWTCPNGVTSVLVKLWGGGGAGGGADADGMVAPGGAGGQYVEKVVTVTPGTTYAIVVADRREGANVSTTIRDGRDSTFNSTDVVAKGGAGGSSAGPGLGSTTGGIGDTVYKGGDGSSGTASTNSGAGGGGAGSTGDGNSASGATAGAAKVLFGGAGGAGRTSANLAGLPGLAYGGGGGGAWRGTVTNRAGGVGIRGRAELVYDDYSMGFFGSLPV